MEVPGIFLILAYNSAILVLFAIGIMIINNRAALTDQHGKIHDWVRNVILTSIISSAIFPVIKATRFDTIVEFTNIFPYVKYKDIPEEHAMLAIWNTLIHPGNEILITLGVLLAVTIVVCIYLIKRK